VISLRTSHPQPDPGGIANEGLTLRERVHVAPEGYLRMYPDITLLAHARAVLSYRTNRCCNAVWHVSVCPVGISRAKSTPNAGPALM